MADSTALGQEVIRAGDHQMDLTDARVGRRRHHLEPLFTVLSAREGACRWLRHGQRRLRLAGC